jgi:hypothetical protein
MNEDIAELAAKAKKSSNSNDALKYSQAALNLTHAVATLDNTRREDIYLEHNTKGEYSGKRQVQ